MSTLRANTLSDASGSNSVPMATVASGTAKAWVNFNGTGTVAIRAAFNVTSITDNGTGDYTVNFLNGMSSVNYSVSGSAGSDAVLGHDSGGLFSEYGMNSRTTLSCRVCTAYVFQGTDTTAAADASLVSVQVV